MQNLCIISIGIACKNNSNNCLGMNESDNENSFKKVSILYSMKNKRERILQKILISQIDR